MTVLAANVRFIEVFDDRKNYGEFFLREIETAMETKTRYSATWVCYSSFGIFGHHWYAMGRPFPEFVQGVKPEYLLEKIGRQIISTEKVLAEVRRAIDQSWDEDIEGREAIAAAIAAVDRIEGEIEEDGAGPEVTLHRLNMDPDISKLGLEWGDMNVREYERSAVMFAEKLWPLFVAEVAKS